MKEKIVIKIDGPKLTARIKEFMEEKKVLHDKIRRGEITGRTSNPLNLEQK